MDLERKLLKIAARYGMTAQTDLLIEEMSELAKALLKYRRAINSAYQPRAKPQTEEELIHSIAEEIADVEIVLQQIKYWYFISPTQLNNIKEEKVNRTLALMKKEVN